MMHFILGFTTALAVEFIAVILICFGGMKK